MYDFLRRCEIGGRFQQEQTAERLLCVVCCVGGAERRGFEARAGTLRRIRVPRAARACACARRLRPDAYAGPRSTLRCMARSTQHALVDGVGLADGVVVCVRADGFCYVLFKEAA